MSRILAAACLALLLAACGGSSDKKTPTPAPTAAQTAKLDVNGCPPAQDPGPRDDDSFKAPGGEPLDPARTYVATVETNCGSFQITLDPEAAPKTSASFKFLADQHFYDGLLFHRIIPGFVIQGGDPKHNGTGGPGYAVVEAPPRTTKYEKYTVAMAKSGDAKRGTSGSQFFVATGDDALKLDPDYALLGKVTGGQDVVDKIGAILTDPRTDYPDAPVLIKSISVAEA